jgi:hypothetical protein
MFSPTVISSFFATCVVMYMIILKSETSTYRLRYTLSHTNLPRYASEKVEVRGKGERREIIGHVTQTNLCYSER